MQNTLRTIAIATAVLVGSGLVTSALAQDKKSAPADKSGTPKTKVYDFSGDEIEGELIKPDGSAIDARDFAKHASLIRIRKDFIPEIIKTAEDL